ncbi:MAG TPA: cysteine peptidase family C39 domain-containing protein, partial [Elainellaceae cyanobacterium]
MLINPLYSLQTAFKAKSARVKTPTLLQMEAVECGAAALGIVLSYYGKIVPLAELRQACGVSRDGVTAANVLKAARNYGMVAKGFKKSLESLSQIRLPFIVFWHFNHFLVVEGFGHDRVYLNDPAAGPRQVTYQEFDEGYTGVVLLLEPGETFQPGGQQPSLISALIERLQHSTGALLFCILAGFLLVLPNLILPALSQIFIDNVLVGGRLSWLPYVLA